MGLEDRGPQALLYDDDDAVILGMLKEECRWL